MKVSMTYTPIYQLPYCCVPVTLQWTFYRRGLPILSQEYLGAELGLRLPPKGRVRFQDKRIFYTDHLPKRGYGTQIHLKKFSIQSLFKRHHIPLKISELQVFEDIVALEVFLKANLKPENDIIARLHTAMFHDEKPVGHFTVITDFDTKTHQLTIGDPNMPFFRQTTCEQLLYGMSPEIDGIQRGLYLVQSINDVN